MIYWKLVYSVVCCLREHRTYRFLEVVMGYAPKGPNSQACSYYEKEDPNDLERLLVRAVTVT